jgi:hypothetical protein
MHPRRNAVALGLANQLAGSPRCLGGRRQNRDHSRLGAETFGLCGRKGENTSEGQIAAHSNLEASKHYSRVSHGSEFC